MLIRRSALAGSSLNLGETSRLVRFITPEGKLSAVLKGARRYKSPLRACERLVEGELVAYRKHPDHLARVREFSITRVFHALRDDYEGMIAGSHVLELAEAVSQEEHAQRALYKLVVETLGTLDDRLRAERDFEPSRRASSLDKILHLFELLLIGETGFAPELSQCANCGRSASEPVILDAAHGVVTCNASRCRHREESVYTVSISSETRMAMVWALQHGSQALSEPPALDDRQWGQWRDTTECLLRVQLDTPLKTMSISRTSLRS